MSKFNFTLEKNAFAQLVAIDAKGTRHEGVSPVRAFPLTSPRENISLVGTDGHEVAWIASLDDLDASQRAVLDEAMASRDFVPVISRIVGVSTYSTPSTWDVETDKGSTSFVLKGEDDIRRLQDGSLLIGASHGVQFAIANRAALDRPSRKILERFL